MQNYKAILLCTFIRLKIFYALLENFIMDYGEIERERPLKPQRCVDLPVDPEYNKVSLLTK